MESLTNRAVCSLCLLALTFVGCQSEVATEANLGQFVSLNSPVMVGQIVEASCGQCNFGMAGGACDLAVRIGSKPYFVDGNTLRDFGDEHAEGGLCRCVRHARVTGELENGRFRATRFELLPLDDVDSLASN